LSDEIRFESDEIGLVMGRVANALGWSDEIRFESDEIGTRCGVGRVSRNETHVSDEIDQTT
jgi:hypothetical protein